ncbi:hypothetical protein [Gordonia sp. NB41Y]|uniref:hypothetical protein n=1 Tax=Gordonia sp. NB41Y TaxID=875808 RepID=UPI00273C63CC|nr:hypothetical protein [Gordonia sp. NB41Y]WLP91796.1 hypothetical protein Q9K23_05975 [Gordonia sp. NB41Y]
MSMAVTGLGLAGVLLTGCAGSDAASPASSEASPTSPAVSVPLDAKRCAQDPPAGRVDRSGTGLRFTHGHMLIAIAPATGPEGASETSCYEFDKSGNPAPEVPPDTLLFTFAGPGTDGAQLEFLVGELTGGVLPPIGAVRPTVGPLTGVITAQVGVSVGGVYRTSSTCRLALTTVTGERMAGHLDCPTAVTTRANPFAPSEDITDDEATASAPDAPAAPAPGPAVSAPQTSAPQTSAPQAPTMSEQPTRLSGWFDLTP